MGGGGVLGDMGLKKQGYGSPGWSCFLCVGIPCWCDLKKIYVALHVKLEGYAIIDVSV